MALPLLYVEQTSPPPTVGTQGAIVFWFDTTSFILKRFNGVEWTPIAAPAPVGIFEVDFGSLPKAEMTFNIVDSRVTSNSVVIPLMSGNPALGKEADELQMDNFMVTAIAHNGNFDVTVRTTDGSYLADNFIITYQVINA